MFNRIKMYRLLAYFLSSLQLPLVLRICIQIFTRYQVISLLGDFYQDEAPATFGVLKFSSACGCCRLLLNLTVSSKCLKNKNRYFTSKMTFFYLLTYVLVLRYILDFLKPKKFSQRKEMVQNWQKIPKQKENGTNDHISLCFDLLIIFFFPLKCVLGP